MKVFSLKSFCYRVVYPTLPLFFLPSSSPSFPLSPSPSPPLPFSLLPSPPPFPSPPLPSPSPPFPSLSYSPLQVMWRMKRNQLWPQLRNRRRVNCRYHSSRRCLNQDLVCCLLKCLRSGLWSLISKHCTRFLDHPFLKLLVLLWFK